MLGTKMGASARKDDLPAGALSPDFGGEGLGFRVLGLGFRV